VIVEIVTQINAPVLAFPKMPPLEKQAPGHRSQEGRTKGSGVMIKTAYAIAVSAIAAFLFVAFPSLSPQVGASAPIVGAKGDRADIRPLGVDCGEKAWPYFDAACMRDARIPLLTQPHDVRIIGTDRDF
jgi:hypothetical protein